MLVVKCFLRLQCIEVMVNRKTRVASDSSSELSLMNCILLSVATSQREPLYPYKRVFSSEAPPLIQLQRAGEK